MNTVPNTYFVTQSDQSCGRTTVEIVEAAIEGGVDVVQLREKHLSARQRYELARELRRITDAADVPLIVNDRVDIAAGVDADGVHLGDDDLPIEAARAQLDRNAVVGRSVSTVDGARRAVEAGADYLGVGAIFQTSSKDVSSDEAELGVGVVSDIDDAVDVPLVGIGGISVANAADVVSAGADGVAVISAIAEATDPTAATRDLARAVAEAK